jgi:ubiquinone/menaquinone biosynthesis C-methylase UbiE
MRSSAPLFDELADDYDEHFAVAHRRAYDTLAWDLVQTLLPPRPAVIIDAGCGIGRWARAFAAEGHRVIAIDHAPRMAHRARERLSAQHCQVVEASLDEIELTPSTADLVVAMGSLQYTRQPERTLERFAAWARPGGWVAVLVDSLVAMAIQKLRTGRVDDALTDLAKRRGVWTQRGANAELHLLDRARLDACFAAAGLTDVRSAGLLVSASVSGIDSVSERLGEDWDAQMALERRLMAQPELADLGKQLLMWGRRV